MTKPSKQSIETVKTVVIAVLVTGIFAFVAGMQYQTGLNKHADGKVYAATEALKNQ